MKWSWNFLYLSIRNEHSLSALKTGLKLFTIVFQTTSPELRTIGRKYTYYFILYLIFLILFRYATLTLFL